MQDPPAEFDIISKKRVIENPNDDFFKKFLRPYYVITKDGQYLFASMQKGRRPDRAFYMVPDGYKLGKGQRSFDKDIGKKVYEVVDKYLQKAKLIVQEGVQGEGGYEVGLRITTSLENPHSAYIAWMGKLMIFPPKKIKIACFNTIIPEGLPEKYINSIQEFWSDFEPDEPLTLYDFTHMKNDIRRVLNLHVDYFGGAFKKPNLTMVWNKAEEDGLISYHAGCTKDRVLKGLSGTGKTTLTVGSDLEQDDACLGKPIYNENGKIVKVQLIGLEAASFAKSEELTSKSPEYPGLMKSRHMDENGNHPIVLAMNIDCEGVEYAYKNINGYEVKVPQQIQGREVGSLQCTHYEKSETTNGRFIFLFSELNEEWGSRKMKYLKTECLSFKKYDVLDPIFRVIDSKMAVALDSACESIITSAVAGRRVGERVRCYAATDFMVREQSQQALLKWKMYRDMGLGANNGKLVFFINNAGCMGEHNIHGDQIKKVDENGNLVPKRDKQTGEIARNESGEIRYEGIGEEIHVSDSKKLVGLVEHKKIEKWLQHPIYRYLIPDPRELEEKHGMKNFRKRFNPLKYYTAEEILEFAKRDIEERIQFLEDLFRGQKGEEKLREVINIWKKIKLPSADEIREFYETHYRT